MSGVTHNVVVVIHYYINTIYLEHCVGQEGPVSEVDAPQQGVAAAVSPVLVSAAEPLPSLLARQDGAPPETQIVRFKKFLWCELFTQNDKSK